MEVWGGVTVVAAAAAAGLAAHAPQLAAVQQTLDASMQAWSRGDLDAFMACYEDSPSTTYVSGPRLLRGRAAIRDMYAKRFAGPGGLGRLSMETLEVRPLGTDYALVQGRYHLARDGRPEATGLFTLVFHRSQAGWRIISDHSS